MTQLWQAGVSVHKTNGKKMIMITIAIAILIKITIKVAYPFNFRNGGKIIRRGKT